MWPWCKISDEELETVTGGDIPGLEAIGPCAIAGGEQLQPTTQLGESIIVGFPP